VRRLLVLALLGACATERFEERATLVLHGAYPREIEVIHSRSENLTAVAFWAHQTLPEAMGHLEVEVAGVFEPLAKYTRQIRSEDSRVIVGAIIPGIVTPVRLRFALDGPERFYDIAGPQKTSSGALGYLAAFNAAVDGIDVVLDDPFSHFSFGPMVRAYQVEVLRDDCETLLSGGSDAAETVPVPQPLEPSGAYCVRLRSGAYSESQHLLTRVVTDRVARVVTVEPLVSPVVIVPIFSLELANEDRCSAVLDALETKLAAAPALVIRSFHLSENGERSCRYDEARVISNDAFSQRLSGHLSQAEKPIVLAISVSNVAGFATSTAETLANLDAVVSSAGARLDVGMLGLGAEFFPSVVRSVEWTYASDPRLGDLMGQLLSDILPYQRYAHDPDIEYAYFPQPPAAAFGFKVCDASRAIAPASSLTPSSAFYMTFTEPPPGFRFELESEWTPHFSFLEIPIVLDLEVCRQFCELPQGEGWRTRATCGNEP
jgi:hypothetical protein